LTENALVIHLTDAHVGKLTDDYNLEIARQRIESIPERAVEGKSYDRVLLLLGGDNVDGSEIYPHHAAVSQHSTVKQIAVAGEAIFQAAVRLNKLTGASVEIIGVTGNHGRVGRGADPASNFDAHLIQELALRALHSKLDWLIVRTNCPHHQLIRVGGTKGLLTHRMVKHTGTPAMQVKILAAVLKFDVDWIAAGHFHVPGHTAVEGKHYFAGGTLAGPDSLSALMWRFEPAALTFWQITEGRGPHGFTVLRW
jgi:predicted phosphodiesterase